MTNNILITVLSFISNWSYYCWEYQCCTLAVTFIICILTENIRQRMFHLISQAYTTIEAEEFATYVGLHVEQAIAGEYTPLLLVDPGEFKEAHTCHPEYAPVFLHLWLCVTFLSHPEYAPVFRLGGSTIRKLYGNVKQLYMPCIQLCFPTAHKDSLSPQCLWKSRSFAHASGVGAIVTRSVEMRLVPQIWH